MLSIYLKWLGPSEPRFVLKGFGASRSPKRWRRTSTATVSATCTAGCWHYGTPIPKWTSGRSLRLDLPILEG